MSVQPAVGRQTQPRWTEDSQHAPNTKSQTYLKHEHLHSFGSTIAGSLV